MARTSPPTVIEVKCEGECKNMINIRVDRGEVEGATTIKRKHCRNDHQQFEVHVSASGGIWVYQSDKHGANRRQSAFTKIWQDK